jgi:hypothetical protein
MTALSPAVMFKVLPWVEKVALPDSTEAPSGRAKAIPGKKIKLKKIVIAIFLWVFIVYTVKYNFTLKV